MLRYVCVCECTYPVVLQKLPEEKVPLGGHCLYYSLPLHQIKGSSLHQRLIVNRIITDNYNYLMVGTQIVVINLFSHQFGKVKPTEKL